MPDDLVFEIHEGLPRQGVGRNPYTRRAFEMLPPMERPRILDIGCGSGTPTMELARLSDGEVIGIDIHQPYLDELDARIREAGFEDRVRAVNRSMADMDFPEGSFDLIWSEGSIFIVGFDSGLRDWRRLLRPGGFLAVHDVCWLREDPPSEVREYWKKAYPDIRTIPEAVAKIDAAGYDLIGYFPLPEDAWWIEYYGPLELRLPELREKHAGDPDALAMLDESAVEIEMYRKHSSWYGSVFYVMQRRETGPRVGPREDGR